MSPRTVAVLAHHLRSLDRASRRRLVADLWTARGFDTAMEGSVLVAETASGSERVHVGPARTRPAEVDVVVDLEARDGERSGVRVVDATDLAEMLVYALEPAARRRLCERHFGRPPSKLRPPLRSRLGRRLDVARTALPAVALATLLLVAGTLLVTSAPTSGGAAADPAAVPPADVLENRSPDPVATGAVEIPLPSYPTPPPGGFLNGSLDLEATSSGIDGTGNASEPPKG